jgi:hypothetical protein
MNKKSLVLAAAFFLSPLLVLGGRLLYRLPAGFEDLHATDFLTFGLYWISAGLLLTKMRFAWAQAALISVVVAALNGVQMVRSFGEMGSALPMVQFIFTVSLMCALIMLMSYLDKSLFDRRDNFSILGVADRKNVSTELILENQKSNPIKGKISSLSRSGFLAEVSGFTDPLYLMDWTVSLPEYNIEKLPIHLIEIEQGKKVRAQFGDIDFFTQWKLHQKVKSL